MTLDRFPSFAGRALWLALLILAAGACGHREQIEQYSVPKADAIAALHGIDPKAEKQRLHPATVPTRVLAAIVLRGDDGWFFKLSGPTEAVGQTADEFDTFLKSVHFGKAGPDWTLPQGWTEEPASGVRFATLKLPGDKPLELTVTTLPKEDDDTEYWLANVNRWRGQVGLAPLKAAELPKNSRRVKLADGEALVVDLEGETVAGAASMAPFANRGPITPAQAPATNQAPSAPKISYKTPSGWKEHTLSGIRLVDLRVSDDDQKAEVTVTQVGGDWVANVNRWRGQVELPEASDEEVAHATKEIEIDHATGDYIEIVGPKEGKRPQAMLAVRATIEGRTWFVKMTGDAPLVERERQRFEQFVNSLRFSPSEGAK